MVISRTGDVITIADSFTHNKERVSAIYNLYTDGRGEINRIPFPDAYPMFTVPYSYDRDTTADPIEIKSKTSEEKGKLVRRGAYTFIRRGASKLVRESYTFIQEYRLTSKGRKLAISTLRNGVPQAFAVFQRKD